MTKRCLPRAHIEVESERLLHSLQKTCVREATPVAADRAHNAIRLRPMCQPDGERTLGTPSRSARRMEMSVHCNQARPQLNGTCFWSFSSSRFSVSLLGSLMSQIRPLDGNIRTSCTSSSNCVHDCSLSSQPHSHAGYTPTTYRR